MSVHKDKVLFDGELYDYIEREDGSKRISTEKNSRGFKITIEVSGDEKDHEEGIRALREFYAKSYYKYLSQR